MILDEISLLLLEHLALSGRPEADFHAFMNFAMTEFSEVHYLGDAPRIQRYI